MIFIGYCFVGGDHCADVVCDGISDVEDDTNTSKITKVELQNSVTDIMIMSKSPSTTATTFSRKWTYNTVFMADYLDNLLAGNIAYAADNITQIKIKRRPVDSFTWTTLYIQKIASEDSFTFSYWDVSAKTGTQYEYALIPVISGTEGTYNVSTFTPNYSRIWLQEKDIWFPLDFNTELSLQRNFTTAVTTTLFKKYPFVNKIGKSNYDTGSLKAFFVNWNEIKCSMDLDTAVEYRDSVVAFLTDGKPKLLKMPDGRMWIISITDNITVDESFYQMPIHSFNFTAIGNPESESDLYSAGIIDLDE